MSPTYHSFGTASAISREPVPVSVNQRQRRDGDVLVRTIRVGPPRASIELTVGEALTLVASLKTAVREARRL